jgi:hypothetical protein
MNEVTTETPVRVRANHTVDKQLGEWTTGHHFDVRANHGAVVLDFLLPQIGPGEIVVNLDVDHAMVKLLVPDGTLVDDDDLRRIGRARVKDWTGTASPSGRVVRLVGQMRHGEVRVHRGGIAIVGLVLAGKRHDVQRARKAGRLPDGKR